MALTQRQERFCHEYLADLSAAQACPRAGYRSRAPAAPAELPGKYHGLWTDKMALEVARPAVADDIRGGPPEGEEDG